ncbi:MULTISPECIES: N-acetylmannosamine-6-phosphate 2-epimerase [Romboutsia]|uniref:Putative N-acetylmannosamine-6-phosphate 2-epimerase n=1 Tax=Romboutsia hominis TaxID=1507512 RepID=A0A2P2BRV7_9FIRM|nr:MULTISPECIES: N-acetylmannosamine-6-phosphate 2-epimerase [Romboutsia]MDB8790982.1 N-acetylmannosamine-6-phosphate 2-epimerase [Romboutsia sp. 1001216sp1]MDB8793320.1 N-acetylmannosamine-6-phosphate 2-epimerase [Romboutsia sp. 1001216sp1]MDB8796747.1 N-acetylmannosamine-6-phosphate 2-epimerase [Romboutsia sp. 1001216sp1]MDB8799608.1 N-acetylmannosamine-6-phosphate 2-epimerase [Romboutsia sp. 1001216sp1]MDB8802399.1 N-acetylmannosamine-6-phosphate 2-epimerase [Romboutsia sp. 1001216sp1]
MNKEEIFKSIKGSVVISCQALPNEPLYVEEKSIMYLMARAAKMAGSPAIRTNSVRDVIAIKKETGLPVIGLIKIEYEGSEVYITPTMKEVDELVDAKSDVIALDCTFSKRLNDESINDFIKSIKEKYPDVILMADISTYEEGINAYKCGVDMVGTTMNGYTPQSIKENINNLELVKKLTKEIDIPVIAEGKIHYPYQAKEMLDAGAYAVVVGGAITRPLEIAQRFINAAKGEI